MSVVVTKDDVRDLAKNRAMLPTREELKRMPGVRYTETPDAKAPGGFRWRARYRCNDGHGNMTPAAAAVGEALKPFTRAEIDRQARVQGYRPRQVLYDQAGQAQYVAAEQAEDTERRTGWRSRGRRLTPMPEFGPGETMLWEQDERGEWEPLGIRCYTRPLFGGSRYASRKIVHVSPDGTPWVWNEGCWRKLEEANVA